MIRIVTSRRLSAMTAEHADLDGRTQRAEAKARSLDERLATARAARAAVLEELDRARAETSSHREEVGELLEEVRHANTALQRAQSVPPKVFILTRQGELHSVHTTCQAAKDTAKEHGAASGPWIDIPADSPLSGCSWRVTGLSVHAPHDSVHDERPGVHGTVTGVHGGGTGG